MSELAVNRIILEKNNFYLAVVAVASLSINLLLALILAFSVNKKPLMVYESAGEVTALQSRAFKLDEKVLEGFSRMVAKEYLSFGPASLTSQVEEIKQYLAEGPRDALLDSYKKNEKKIQENNVFQQFSVGEIKITRKSSPFLVEVNGIKTVYASGNSKNIAASYALEVEMVKQTQDNPYGLIVTKIKENPKLTREDKK